MGIQINDASSQTGATPPNKIMLFFSDGYSVTEAGAVWSSKSNRWLKQSINSQTGYRMQSVKIRGRHYNYLVHRLVAHKYIGPCPAGIEVNHIDGDKANSHLSNLEYVTRSENLRHAVRTGLLVRPKGKDHPMAKLTEMQVINIRHIGRSVSQHNLAALYGVTRMNIKHIIDRSTWKHLAINSDISQNVAR